MTQLQTAIPFFNCTRNCGKKTLHGIVYRDRKAQVHRRFFSMCPCCICPLCQNREQFSNPVQVVSWFFTFKGWKQFKKDVGFMYLHDLFPEVRAFKRAVGHQASGRTDMYLAKTSGRFSEQNSGKYPDCTFLKGMDYARSS